MNVNFIFLSNISSCFIFTVLWYIWWEQLLFLLVKLVAKNSCCEYNDSIMNSSGNLLHRNRNKKGKVSAVPYFLLKRLRSPSKTSLSQEKFIHLLLFHSILHLHALSQIILLIVAAQSWEVLLLFGCSKAEQVLSPGSLVSNLSSPPSRPYIQKLFFK